MQYFEKGHFFIQESKNFFLFFMGDESLNCTCMGRFDTSGTSKNDNFPKVDLNVDNFELWMTVMSAVEQMEQVRSWILTCGH